MPGIDYTLGMQTSGFTGGINKAFGGIKSLGGMVSKVAGPVAAIAGVASLTAGIGKAIGKAAEMETLETAFQPLLGGAKQAEDRIAELAAFAASTPFELPGIAAASKTLETLTRGALSTGDGLRTVGDVAAATGRPFDEIATTIGRLYDGLDSGRPVGEAMARLQELGVISGDTRGQLEALQKEGKKGAEVWAVAEGALGRFSGSMDLQSQTWNGKLSTLKDNVGLAFAAFGEPIVDAIKPFLDKAIGATGSLVEKATAFGKKIGETISFMVAVFQSGEVMSIVANSLKIGFMEGVNFLWKGLRAAISAAGELLPQAIRNAMLYFEVLTTPDFWKGMGNAIIGIFLSAIAFLQKGLGEALEIARPLAELFGKGDTISSAQETLNQSGGILQDEANSRFGEAGDQLGPVADKIAKRAEEMGGAIASRFRDTFDKTANVMDASVARAGLDTSFDKIRANLDQAAEDIGKAPAEAIAQEAAGPVIDDTEKDTPGAAASRQIQANRLQQIGGYVGAGLGAAKDRIAERTEQWTRKTAEAVTKLANRKPTPATSGTATF